MIKTQIWAHRGASAYAPENTMPAFEMAARMGADGIETDVHLTIDDEMVVCHDDILDRVSNGTGPICEKTLAQLRLLDFSAVRTGYQDVRILTLQELLVFAKEKGLFVNIEMKYSGNRWDETNEKTAAIAKQYGMEDRIIYSSFKAEPLLKLKKMVHSKVALLYGQLIEKPWDLALEKGFDALHPHYIRIYEQQMVQQCRETGIMLNPWTIDEPADIRATLEIGVDAVITNKPDIALQIRDQLCLVKR
jgi:glycerophosphoryl diester phosphodiesterase